MAVRWVLVAAALGPAAACVKVSGEITIDLHIWDPHHEREKLRVQRSGKTRENEEQVSSEPLESSEDLVEDDSGGAVGDYDERERLPRTQEKREEGKSEVKLEAKPEENPEGKFVREPEEKPEGKLVREPEGKPKKKLKRKLDRESEGKLVSELEGKLERELKGKLERASEEKLEREPKRKVEKEPEGNLEREPEGKLEREPEGKLEREPEEKPEINSEENRKGKQHETREGKQEGKRVVKMERKRERQTEEKRKVKREDKAEGKRVENRQPKRKKKRLRKKEEKKRERHVRGREYPDNVTAATPLKCVYQVPERRQVDALLGNMMNHLTKMYIRVHKALESKGALRVRRDKKRFDVVSGSRAAFFDAVYANMSREYRRFVNETTSSKPFKHHPCHHQPELRDLWKKLLDTSQASLQRAVLACVDQYLLVERAAEGGSEEAGAGAGEAEGEGEGEPREQASRMVARELGRVRHDQLELLCDSFQLCYHDLVGT